MPEAKAIQLLGYDDHAEIVPLVREVYKRAKGAAREEALRVLATDPQSERLFTRLLKDKSETAEHPPQLSASGLQSLNPEAFDRAARKIVADEDDYNDIRATSLAALAHGREAREKPVDPKLVETVQKVGETTRSRAMRSATRASCSRRSNDGRAARGRAASARDRRRPHRRAPAQAGRGADARRDAGRAVAALRRPRHQRGRTPARLRPRELRDRRTAAGGQRYAFFAQVVFLLGFDSSYCWSQAFASGVGLSPARLT